VHRPLTVKDRSQGFAEEALPRTHIFVIRRPRLQPFILAVATHAEKWLRLEIATNDALKPHVVQGEADH
jgi:hypothetical protein